MTPDIKIKKGEAQEEMKIYANDAPINSHDVRTETELKY